ncbi:MAG: ABC transporter substrate-binding protein [Deltaproteobacteria bacterium]|nr:ABC transporter substrate-binding protein [Deltaproteobacteria bacterium]
MRHILGVLVIVFAAAACKPAADEIRIGYYASMTGSTATWGQMGKHALDLAIEEANAQGGLLGKKIRLYTEDDQGLPEQAKAAALKLITQRKVVALIGEHASSRCLAAAPEAQRHKVPMISPFCTNPKVTSVGDHIFRVCYIDPFQGGAMAQFAAETLQVRRAAILRDIKNDYSVGLADFFKAAFEKRGGTIVADAAYSEGDIEFRSQLTQIRAAQPEAIFIPGYYTDVGLIARQARELGMQIPLLGGDGWDSPKTVEIGGPAINGAFFSSSFAADDPAGMAFNQKFQAKFGKPADGLASTTYEAALVLFDAVRRAGTTEAKAVRDALAATKNFQGVAGKLSLDGNRDAVKRIVIMKIEDGKMQFHSAVEPS